MRRREVNVFSLSFLDLISGALGAVIILYVAVPKANPLQKTLDEELKKSQQTVTELKNVQAELAQLKELQQTAQTLITENENLKAQLAAVPVPEPPKPEQDEGAGLDVGFKFQGRNIIFILDTSLSMLNEDRMGQVKAGLKMLITSMPARYNIEIIQFPNGRRSAYRPLFKELKPLNKETKLDAFDFIYALKPLGATPTRDVLNYVFQHYTNVSDIVLLTDGEPSLHESPLKDDIYDILNNVRKLNSVKKIQINTIGVGEEVLHDKTGKPYQFLRVLAEQNAGFFVGF
jgi:hypothetical protein